ncbi:MAG: hypothetical protein IJ233_00640, partial [Pyramidobacter sp.]|nr:hypothetical protein [Pyramidobacter sp.]
MLVKGALAAGRETALLRRALRTEGTAALAFVLTGRSLAAEGPVAAFVSEIAARAVVGRAFAAGETAFAVAAETFAALVITVVRPERIARPVVEAALAACIVAGPRPVVEAAFTAFAVAEPRPVVEAALAALAVAEPRPVVETAFASLAVAEPRPVIEAAFTSLAVVNARPVVETALASLAVAESWPIVKITFTSLAVAESRPVIKITLAAFTVAEPWPVVEIALASFTVAEPRPVIEAALAALAVAEPWPVAEAARAGGTLFAFFLVRRRRRFFFCGLLFAWISPAAELSVVGRSSLNGHVLFGLLLMFGVDIRRAVGRFGGTAFLLSESFFSGPFVAAVAGLLHLFSNLAVRRFGKTERRSGGTAGGEAGA